MVWVVLLCSLCAVVGARQMAVRTVEQLRETGPVWADRNCARDVRVVVSFGVAVVWASTVRAEPSMVVLAWSTMFFALVDLDTHSVPMTHARVATGLAALVAIGATPWTTASFVDMLIGAVVATLAMKALVVLSRGDLGTGDVALAPIVGLHAGWMAWQGALSALAAALVLAGACAFIGVVSGKLRAR